MAKAMLEAFPVDCTCERLELTLPKLAASTELPIPSIHTGRSVYCSASSPFVSNIAEAPLQIF
ncbi:MAG: hypothetical protein QOK51_04095 [Nitrososphaeraceae archaeon]|nr:hypothetical protein [Nitrososphaeraceae archaeon]